MDRGLVAAAALGDARALDTLVDALPDLGRLSRELESSVEPSDHALRRRLIALLYERGGTAVLTVPWIERMGGRDEEFTERRERSLSEFTCIVEDLPTQFVWPLSCPAIWSPDTAMSFECDAAEHVLELHESLHPGDARLRAGIEMKRKWIRSLERRELDDAFQHAARPACAAYDEAGEASDREPESWPLEAAMWAAKSAWDVMQGAGSVVDPIEAARSARGSGYARETRWQEARVLALLTGSAHLEA